MKPTNSIMTRIGIVATIALLTIACGKSGSTGNTPSEPEINEWKPSDLATTEKLISVKIGESSIQELNIAKGAGEYSAFAVDTTVVRVKLVDKKTMQEGGSSTRAARQPQRVNRKIMLEGLRLGRTDVILSDKSGKYIKVPVTVYRVDEIKLSTHELNLPGLPKSKKRIEVEVLDGNGGYSCESDNDRVIVAMDPTGKKVILSLNYDQADFTANITVKDQSDKVTVLKVKGEITDNPFTPDVVEEILKQTPRYYSYNGEQINFWGNNNKHGRNSYLYGGNQWGDAYTLSFSGDHTTGTKTKGKLVLRTRSGRNIETDVDLEILKADGTTAYIVYKYTDSTGKINYGYIVDKDLSAMPESLELAKTSLTFTPTKDEPETIKETIKVNSGKGPFTFVSSRETIQVKEVEGDIQVTATTIPQRYDANIIVTDANDQKMIVNITVEGFLKPLEISEQNLNIQGENEGEEITKTVKILSGGGGYTVESDTPDKVTATLTGNTISIVAKSGAQDYTAIVTVEDRYDQNSRIYVNVKRAKEVVRSELKVSKSRVTLSGQKGTRVEEEVTILSGAGGYRVTSGDPSVTATLVGDKIRISATPDDNQHIANIILTDSKNQELAINVTVQPGASAGGEYADFLADNTVRYFYQGERPLDLSRASFLKSSTQFGFRIFSRPKIQVSLFGFTDRTVGVKQNVRITVLGVWNKESMMQQYPVRSLEVLKNDGTNVWIKLSYGTKSNATVTLFICDKLQ